mmetsp:Transcript_31689/g.73558  ORF Transcript_31689/g.73558 Transcript_31689/m.73558 type:complete len:220 (+) Transcript_31689:461-1120(+)
MQFMFWRTSTVHKAMLSLRHCREACNSTNFLCASLEFANKLAIVPSRRRPTVGWNFPANTPRKAADGFFPSASAGTGCFFQKSLPVIGPLLCCNQCAGAEAFTLPSGAQSVATSCAILAMSKRFERIMLMSAEQSKRSSMKFASTARWQLCAIRLTKAPIHEIDATMAVVNTAQVFSSAGSGQESAALCALTPTLVMKAAAFSTSMVHCAIDCLLVSHV